MGFLTGLNCFRARLKNIEFAVDAVFAPFDIHRASIMLFNDSCVLGKFNDFAVIQSKLLAFGFGNVNDFNGSSGGFICIEDHFNLLASKYLTDNREIALFKHRLMNKVFVRINGTLNHCFA